MYFCQVTFVIVLVSCLVFASSQSDANGVASKASRCRSTSQTPEKRVLRSSMAVKALVTNLANILIFSSKINCFVRLVIYIYIVWSFMSFHKSFALKVTRIMIICSWFIVDVHFDTFSRGQIYFRFLKQRLDLTKFKKEVFFQEVSFLRNGLLKLSLS